MQIIAHRGASYFEPENTLRSFKRAIEMGADFVEMDIRMSQDKEPVVIHDADVNRTTNGSGLVKDKTLSELKKLDAGLEESIPTLDEVVRLTKNKIGLVIEIKEPGTENKIIEKINENNLKNTILASFYHESIKNAKELDSSVNAGIIFACQPVNVIQLAFNANADIIFPSHRYMNENMVKEAKKHDITVYPWAIDDPDMFKKFAEMGVNGIVTNKLIEK